MRRAATGQVTSTIVAVVSVAVIAVALVGFLIGDSDDENPAAAEGQTTASPAAEAGESSSRSANAAEDQATGSAASPEPTAKEKAQGKQDDKSKKSQQKRKKNEQEKTSEPEPAVPSVYVEVYNMTSVSGLAASKAAQLQDAGWQVVGIDNWRGNVPASTVYYPDGMADEATQLANSLGIGRTRGAVAPMKFDRLTVILTSDAV